MIDMLARISLTHVLRGELVSCVIRLTLSYDEHDQDQLMIMRASKLY